MDPTDISKYKSIELGDSLHGIKKRVRAKMINISTLNVDRISQKSIDWK